MHPTNVGIWVILIEAQHPQTPLVSLTPSFGPDVPRKGGTWFSYEMWMSLTSPNKSQPDNQLEGATWSQH